MKAIHKRERKHEITYIYIHNSDFLAWYLDARIHHPNLKNEDLTTIDLDADSYF